jgi:hypothetical protein
MRKLVFLVTAATSPEDHKVAAAYTAPGFCNDDAFTVPDCPGQGVLGFVQNDVGVVILADAVTRRHAPR